MLKKIPYRKTLTALTLSVAGFVGIAEYEGYSETAVAPVKGDVPTIGFGQTGPTVKKGDKTDPIRALIQLQQTVNVFEIGLKRCIGDVPLFQYEYDAYLSWTYNVGVGAACRSTLLKKLKKLDYAGACKELLRWNKFKGKPLRGLTRRRQDEYHQCIGLKEAA